MQHNKDFKYSMIALVISIVALGITIISLFIKWKRTEFHYINLLTTR